MVPFVGVASAAFPSSQHELGYWISPRGAGLNLGGGWWSKVGRGTHRGACAASERGAEARMTREVTRARAAMVDQTREREVTER